MTGSGNRLCVAITTFGTGVSPYARACTGRRRGDRRGIAMTRSSGSVTCITTAALGAGVGGVSVFCAGGCGNSRGIAVTASGRNLRCVVKSSCYCLNVETYRFHVAGGKIAGK